MDEIYGVSPLRLTAGLRKRAFLSREDFQALGDETTRRELEKLRATREFTARAAEMQRREEELRIIARRADGWKRIRDSAQVASVIGVLCACMAMCVVVFANIFPASMGLVPQRGHSAEPQISAEPVRQVHVRIPAGVQFHPSVEDAAELWKGQEGILTSDLIAPLRLDFASMCMHPLIHPPSEVVAPSGQPERTDAGAIEQQDPPVQPSSDVKILPEMQNPEFGVASTFLLGHTSCPRHGESISLWAHWVPPPAEPGNANPMAQIEDVPETLPRLPQNSPELHTLPGFVPALPLPPPKENVPVIEVPAVESDAPCVSVPAPPPSSGPRPNSISECDAPDSSMAVSMLFAMHALDAAVPSSDKDPTLSKTQPLSPSSRPSALSSSATELASSFLEADPQGPEHALDNELPPSANLPPEALKILRGSWQHSACLPTDYDPEQHQRLVGVKSIAMPPVSVMKAAVCACGAALSYHVSWGVHLGSCVFMQLSAALQHEPVVYVAAWAMLLSVMIMTAYMLLSTEGVPEPEYKPPVKASSARSSVNLHLCHAVPPGGHGSPEHQPGQLFPGGSAERDTSGSPVATAVVTSSQERRVTPQPLFAAESSESCQEAGHEESEPSDSLPGSVGEVGPSACASETNVQQEDPLQRLQDEERSGLGKDARIAELLEEAGTTAAELKAAEALVLAVSEDARVQRERADKLEVRLAADAARADNAEATVAQLEARAAIDAAVDAAVIAASQEEHGSIAGKAGVTEAAAGGSATTEEGALTEECDRLEAVVEEVNNVCARRVAQDADLQELVRQSEQTLMLLQQQVKQEAAVLADDSVPSRALAVQKHLEDSIEDMLLQIRALVQPTGYLAKRVYGQSAPESQLTGENWHYEVCNVMKQAAVQLDAAEATEHTVVAVIGAMLEGGDVSGVVIDDSDLSETMLQQLQRLKGFAMEAWASRQAVMAAASGLAGAVDAPAMSTGSSGWQWSSEIKGILDKAASEVGRMQAAEEGVVAALDAMLVSDDLQLENSSVSSAAAESLARVHFQLQEASGRESNLVRQVKDLVQRQADLEQQLCNLEAGECGAPSPNFLDMLVDTPQHEGQAWLQQYGRLMQPAESDQVVSLHLDVAADGHVDPVLEVRSRTQAGLQSLSDQLQDLLRDEGPVSHIRTPKAAVAAPVLDPVLEDTRGRQQDLAQYLDGIEAAPCFQHDSEADDASTPAEPHPAGDGAAELQRVLDNAATHAGLDASPQVVFDGAAISDAVSERYSKLEAEFLETHLTSGEGRQLHKYLSDTLAHAVTTLPTPSASEASYSGDTENEENRGAGTGDNDSGYEACDPWSGKFAEQHMYVDVVAQNLSGLVDQQTRFLHCLAELVTCQEQQETARRAHTALHRRVTQWREAMLDGSPTPGQERPGQGDARQLSASREALLAQLTDFQPLADGSRDLDTVMQQFHEVEAELALRGSPREGLPEHLVQLQHDCQELEELQALMQVSAAALQEDVAQARAAMCSTVEVLHENTLSLFSFFAGHGLAMPQEISALVNKMAAQVAEADAVGFGTPAAARGLAGVLAGAGVTRLSESIAKVQDWQTNPSMLDSLSPVLHFPSPAAGTPTPDLTDSTAGLLSDSGSPGSASMHPSPAWAGICNVAANPASPDDPPLSPPDEPTEPLQSPRPLRFKPLAFTTSAPEMPLPTPTFGPSPFHTAVRAPPTAAPTAARKSSSQSFLTPCGTEPSSAAHGPGSAAAPSPLTGADVAAAADDDFMSRRLVAVASDDALPEPKVSPRLPGVSPEHLPSAGPPMQEQKPPSAGAATSGASSSGTAELAGDAPSRMAGPDRPTGIRRNSGAGPRQSLQSHDLARSRLPRAPARMSAPAQHRRPSPTLVELTQVEPSPAAPLTAHSPLPTSLQLSLVAYLEKSGQAADSTAATSAGPSIPSAPAAQVMQREPSPPSAQQPQQPLPAVPSLLPSSSPAPLPRSRSIPPSEAAPAREGSPPEQLQDQDVRQAVAVPQHIWQQAIREARQSPEEPYPPSPRGSMAKTGGLAPAISLLDIDSASTPGLDMSLGAFGELSPVPDNLRRSPVATPPGTEPGKVLFTHNALFDSLTPPIVAVPAGKQRATQNDSQQDWSEWQGRQGRQSPDENSNENVPAVFGL